MTRIKITSTYLVIHDGEVAYGFRRVWQVQGGAGESEIFWSFETAIAEADRRARGLSAALLEVP